MTTISCTYALDISVFPVKKLFHHSHGCTELIFIRAGTGFVSSSGTLTRYRKGQLIVYQPGASHADKATESGVQFCIGVHGVAAEYLPPGVWDCSGRIRDAEEELHYQMLAPESPWKSLDMDLLAGNLVRLIRLDLPANVPQASAPDICEKARRELDAHIGTPYTLDQLTDKVFVSKSYLRKLFKEKYGESPLSYLLRKKLDLAAELLLMTNLPVQEIAARIGIDNPFYFSTLFSRRKGMPPTSYRNAHKKRAQ